MSWGLFPNRTFKTKQKKSKHKKLPLSISTLPRHLIERANYWLRRNSHWKLINCETVKLLYRHNLTNMVSRWEQQINPATAMWSGSQLRTNEYETSLKVLR